MAEGQEVVRIAVNTMRARLTVLGFNLAIITFQINSLPRSDGGAHVAGFAVPLHVSTVVALHFALVLTIVAMVAFIVSGRLSEDGACDHWSLLVGDVLMYVGLAYTVLGFFEPLFLSLSAHSFADPSQAADYASLRNAIATLSMMGWIMAAYVGPVVSLLRAPFRKPVVLAVALGYVGMLTLLAYFWVIANDLQLSLEELRSDTDYLVRRFLFPPLDWFVDADGPSRS